jgi:hypothetical protein
MMNGVSRDVSRYYIHLDVSSERELYEVKGTEINLEGELCALHQPNPFTTPPHSERRRDNPEEQKWQGKSKKERERDEKKRKQRPELLVCNETVTFDRARTRLLDTVSRNGKWPPEHLGDNTIGPSTQVHPVLLARCTPETPSMQSH